MIKIRIYTQVTKNLNNLIYLPGKKFRNANIHEKRGKWKAILQFFCHASFFRDKNKKNNKKCEVFFIVSGKALYLQSENEFRGNKLLNIKYL